MSSVVSDDLVEDRNNTTSEERHRDVTSKMRKCKRSRRMPPQLHCMTQRPVMVVRQRSGTRRRTSSTDLTRTVKSFRQHRRFLCLCGFGSGFTDGSEDVVADLVGLRRALTHCRGGEGGGRGGRVGLPFLF